jgi:hypothetical protein
MFPTKFQFIWSSGFRGEDFFRNRPIRNKNGLWRQCLLTDRDEMSNREQTWPPQAILVFDWWFKKQILL